MIHLPTQGADYVVGDEFVGANAKRFLDCAECSSHVIQVQAMRQAIGMEALYGRVQKCQ